MKGKKRWLGLAALSLLLCGSGGILALSETSVTNPFGTGVVDIQLLEYQRVDGKEQPYADAENILPGQYISKIPRIHNRGADCYVRAKLTLKDTAEEIAVRGMGERWMTGEDGYYYYTEILPAGADTDVFEGIQIPEDFSQEEEGRAFALDIDVDAIQSRNFTPDFDSAAPWGPVQIQRCIREGTYDFQTMEAAEKQSLRVCYQGESERLFTDAEDFFVNFPVLMPGDTYEDTAVLQNDSDAPTALYFRSAAERGQELVEKIGLSIMAELEGQRTEIYQGTLDAEELRDGVLLATLPAGAEGTFRFKITVPPELDNRYTVLTNQVQWVFSTEPIRPEEPGIPTEVRTGDTRRTGALLLAAGSLLGVGTFLLRRKSNGSKETL